MGIDRYGHFYRIDGGFFEIFPWNLFMVIYCDLTLYLFVSTVYSMYIYIY